MTKEQAIEEVNKAFEPAFANYIITALTEGATVSDKALEQQPSDCVSRAEVNKLYDEYRPRLATHVSEFGDKLKALPPVTPTFPKGATNGDMVKALFPNAEIKSGDKKENRNIIYVWIDNWCIGSFRLDWWNAPYKRGDENEVD